MYNIEEMKKNCVYLSVWFLEQTLFGENEIIHLKYLEYLVPVVDLNILILFFSEYWLLDKEVNKLLLKLNINSAGIYIVYCIKWSD